MIPMLYTLGICSIFESLKINMVNENNIMIYAVNISGVLKYIHNKNMSIIETII